MRKRIIITALLVLTTACASGSADNLDALYKGLPFDMPRVALPSIPRREVVLTDFGGVGEDIFSP